MLGRIIIVSRHLHMKCLLAQCHLFVAFSPWLSTFPDFKERNKQTGLVRSLQEETDKRDEGDEDAGGGHDVQPGGGVEAC